MNPSDEHELERLIHQTLRDLPVRRAPQSLELRVFAAIERRAASPWWHKSFAHWPLLARIAFVGLSIGLVSAVIWLVAGYDGAQLQAAVAAQFGWARALGAVVVTMVDLIQGIIRAIPPLWLYGVLGVVAALYGTLFGLGAAAYRTLYASR